MAGVACCCWQIFMKKKEQKINHFYENYCCKQHELEIVFISIQVEETAAAAL